LEESLALFAVHGANKVQNVEPQDFNHKERHHPIPVTSQDGIVVNNPFNQSLKITYLPSRNTIIRKNTYDRLSLYQWTEILEKTTSMKIAQLT
jgi:hypothetical protein